MLQNGSLRDEAAQRHAVDVIVRSATTQTQLVEDLLDLSRLVTGGMKLTFEACDLGAIVQEALDTVRPAAHAKGTTVSTTIASGITILCAPERLRQVVWNLAMNAIKFTPTGGHIDITVARTGDRADVVLRDTGVGISPDVLPHIFEPFRQEDSSTVRGHGGLGLGLALVKRIIELHGGTARGESAGKGQGATFTVSIPVAPPRP
jgi:signal transduction histidine kinase